MAVHLALIVVQILFASLAIAGRYVLREFPAGALVLFRVVGAAIVLLLVNAIAGGHPIRNRRHVADLALLGLLGVAANQGLYVYGLRHTTAINATILVTTVPVFTVLWSVLAGREKASPLKIGGIALAGAGVIYLIGPDRLSMAHDVALGNAMIVIGMACYAGYFVLSKRIVALYHPRTVTTYAMVFGAIATLPFGVPAALTLHPSAIHALTWVWVAYIVIFPTIVTYLLNIWALARVSSSTVAAYVYLQPFFAAAVAPLVLAGESVGLRTLIAGVTIFVGLGLILWAERRQRVADVWPHPA
ncbi:MAG: DMT family transporter [Gemmatimonadales bacterium]|nr:DMT family transporter [Gemmatimonadales bacterium]